MFYNHWFCVWFCFTGIIHCYILIIYVYLEVSMKLCIYTLKESPTHTYITFSLNDDTFHGVTELYLSKKETLTNTPICMYQIDLYSFRFQILNG